MTVDHPIIRCEHCGCPDAKRYATKDKKYFVVRYFTCAHCKKNFSTKDTLAAEIQIFQEGASGGRQDK